MKFEEFAKKAQKWREQEDARLSAQRLKEQQAVAAEWDKVYGAIRRAVPVDGLTFANRSQTASEIPARGAPIDVYVSANRLKKSLLMARLNFTYADSTEGEWAVTEWQWVSVTEDGDFIHHAAASLEDAFYHAYLKDQAVSEPSVILDGGEAL